jgi:hypothetical protein
MLDNSKSDAKRYNAELLQWIGTAYGRRREENSPPRANASAAFHLDQLARHKRGVMAILLVLLTITATALVQVHASARFLGLTWTEKTRQMGTSQQRIELEQEAKAQLTREHEARVALEAQVGQLVSELAAQTRERDTAERASADASAQLIAEQKARVDAEDAAKASKEVLSRIERATPTAVALPLTQKTQGERKTIETLASWDATARVAASVNAAANSDAANSALLQGENLFAKGDLEAARQRFEQVAKMGMPEGALALGNTFDPVSLAKAGVNQTGDPRRARQWYRRALELAQIHREQRE